MLSIEKLAAGREDYYVRAVAYGVEDYYPESGEVPGRWVGAASSRLGLSGEVDGDDFRSVLSGVDPSSGERLRRANGRVNGLDFTFSAPKSVSIVWALGGGELSDAVVDAHEHAVDAALEYLEREAVRSRRGRNGTEVLDGDGLVAAAFRHRTSRAGDPQLHTHVVIANTTRCGDDGVWRTLDGRHLYAHAQVAGYLYQAELRRALRERLGVEWGPVTKGCADLLASPQVLLEEFSRRRHQIDHAAHDAGDTSIRARRRFAVTTRTAKDHDVDGETLTVDWQQRAALHGVDQAVVEGWCRPPRAPTHRPHTAETGLTHDRLAEILTEHQTTFDRRDVLRQLAHHAQQGASVTELEERAEQFLAGPQLVPVGLALTCVRYTTDELIAVEEHLIATAEARRDDGVAMCHQVAATLDAHPSLSAEQHTMVDTITTDGAGVSVVVGAAGTGKTFALAAARQAWLAENYRVFGCALAARAAAELQVATGIPSSSLDLLLDSLDRPHSPGLERRSVVVVDEAAMVGTRKLARLLDHAHAAHAKVVLVGDHHQLPEIKAGGAFAALAHRLDALELADNRRQHDPIERATSTALRHSDTNRALALLAGHGRLHQHRGRDETGEQIVSDWLDAILDGRDAIMLTATRADAADLNQRARRLLRAEGAISDQFLDVGGHDFGIGDHVMTLRNDYRHGILNGQRGTVIAIGHFSQTLTVAFGTDDTKTIPAAYLDQGHLDHAYAMTIHKAQGLTCDVALVLADERLHREAAYTALTRGRHENHLYLADKPDEHTHHWHQHHDDQHDTLRRALQRSEQQDLAIDQGTRPSQFAALGQRPEPAEPDLDNGIDLGL
jgi:conjugative relaxase-like TrwC/TraI family protein